MCTHAPKRVSVHIHNRLKDSMYALSIYLHMISEMNVICRCW